MWNFKKILKGNILKDITLGYERLFWKSMNFVFLLSNIVRCELNNVVVKCINHTRLVAKINFLYDH